MTRTFIAVLLLLLAGVVAAQPGPADPVTVEFRAVTDAGSPVVDLKASDVVLKVGGRERVIERLQRFQFGDAAPSSAIAPPFATNVASAAGIHDTILLIDDQSIAPGDEKRLGPAIDLYMAGLARSARVGITTVQDRGLGLELTADRDAIRALVRKIVGRAVSGEGSEESACRTRRVLDSLTMLTARFPPGGAPASVLLFTTGLTPPGTTVKLSSVGNIGSGNPSEVCEVTSREYQEFQRRLLDSTTNLHVVEAALAPSRPMRDGLEMLAGVSGNKVAEVVSGTEGALTGLAVGMRGWYRATFVPEARERNDDVQRVEVESKRAGVKTVARSQVLIPRVVSSLKIPPKDMLREARMYRDFELNAGAYFSREPGTDKIKVLVMFEPALAGARTTAASAALFDMAGKLIVQGSADDFALARSPAIIAVLAPAGRYRLRVAAVDDRGRAGTVDQRVDVALVPAGPLTLATLVPGVQAKDDGFPGRLQFAGAETAMAYVAVYGASAATKLSAELTVVDAAGTNLGALPTQILEAPDGSHVIMGGLRLYSLAAGDYEMKMVVSVDGKAVGQTAHSFRRR
jgi:hypothetical protein